MADFDLILLGEAPLTYELKNEFDGKVKLFFIGNKSISNNFSSDIFPSVSFVPTNKEVDGIYGQVTTPELRFDLTSEREVLNLLWQEELRESDLHFNSTVYSCATESNIANMLLLEHYGDSFFSILTYNFEFAIKNAKLLTNFFMSKLNQGKCYFKKFLETLNFFFAPGEINYRIFDKYLIYSLLSKKPHKIFEKTNDSQSYIDNNDFGKLKAITYGSDWEIRFEKQKVTGKVLVSAVPPHIFSLMDISNPFSLNYNTIFYKFIPEEKISSSPAMAEQLVFIDGTNRCFINNTKENIEFFVPASLNNTPDVVHIKPALKNLFPHITHLPKFKILPHVYPFYSKQPQKHITTGKNLYFSKNIEYPYLGIDGEILFRKRIKEILWKKLL